MKKWLPVFIAFLLFVSLYREITPPSGYYYRVRGVHTAESGGIKEVLHSVTDIYY